MDKIVIIAPKGARKNKKIIGRGNGSGYGGTSGKGSKGQNARSGGGVRPGFEGGQMPLYRRIATRGFSNVRFKKIYTIVKLGDLEVFENGARITKEELLKKRIIKKKSLPIKILVGGEFTKKLIVESDKISKNALEKIISLGGEVIAKHNPSYKQIVEDEVKSKDKPKEKSKDKDKVKDKPKTKAKEQPEVKAKDKPKKEKAIDKPEEKVEDKPDEEADDKTKDKVGDNGK